MAKPVKIHVPWFPIHERWKATENATAHVPRFLPVVRIKRERLAVVTHLCPDAEDGRPRGRVMTSKDHSWWRWGEIEEVLGVLDYEEN